MVISARGPLSAWALGRLQLAAQRPAPTPTPADAFTDDLQLALYLTYELHFNELPAVPADREWDPELIRFRSTLEDAFVDGLRDLIGPQHPRCDLRVAIPAIIDADGGPSLSSYMETRGTLAEMREAVRHRSPYQLKEGDAHTLAIPRLHGRAKQILAEIQAGEYGADAPGREMHSTLFAQTMRALGLDDRRNAYIDSLPASAFMVSNLISLFGLNRRWRGALVGHLAVFEMTSVVPMGRYSRGLERMGAPAAARRFYDVHVMADAEHERLALDMACAFADDELALVPDILFGARAVVAVEGFFAGTLLDSFAHASAATKSGSGVVPHLAA